MKLKFKLIVAAIITLLIVGLVTTTTIMRKRIQTLNKEVAAAVTNIKAYELENSGLKDNAIAFQYTIEQLNHSNDSLVKKINTLKKELKIKDKDIQNLTYLASQTQKKDSIVFVHDTLFKENVKVDTLVADEWSKMHLQLEYPNTIVADYSFKNEVLVASYLKKETIKPPHKCWLGRLFQKKHKVVRVVVSEQNPYCEIKEQKFINIVD